jgi:hypothetical protein
MLGTAAMGFAECSTHPNYHCSHCTMIGGDRWPDGHWSPQLLRLPWSNDCLRHRRRHHPRPLRRQTWTGRFR